MTVLCRALCSNLMMDSSLKVNGVEVVNSSRIRRSKKKSQIYARKEVILCGGAINTPQILQMSGIGPAKVLSDVGVEVKVNSEGVGAHLQDHLQFEVNVSLISSYILIIYSQFTTRKNPGPLLIFTGSTFPSFSSGIEIRLHPPYRVPYVRFLDFTKRKNPILIPLYNITFYLHLMRIMVAHLESVVMDSLITCVLFNS